MLKESCVGTKRRLNTKENLLGMLDSLECLKPVVFGQTVTRDSVLDLLDTGNNLDILDSSELSDDRQLCWDQKDE